MAGMLWHVILTLSPAAALEYPTLLPLTGMAGQTSWPLFGTHLVQSQEQLVRGEHDVTHFKEERATRLHASSSRLLDAAEVKHGTRAHHTGEGP